MRERQKRWHLTSIEWTFVIALGWAIVAYTAA